ncbi:MAG: FkbM family methyltransferase [Bacteroidetes bacterium]|nr:FkbM family methyltransferase [Bacteroidota bacterium]
MKKIAKWVYDFIPKKKYIYLLIKKIGVPSPSIFKHLHFKDVFEVAINNHVKFKINHFGLQIENEIFWLGLTGGWEKESIKIWLKLCEKSNVVFDVGANTGVYALMAKAVNKQSRVFAFEPNPYFYKMLCDNIKINNYNIIPIDKIVSNTNDTQTIEDYSGQVKELSLNAITLDFFIKQQNLPVVDLIKIDVETHEPLVFEGFLKYLKLFKPTILVEILNEEIANKIQDSVQSLGYLYFNIDEVNGPIQTEKIEKSRGYNYLLCSKEKAIELQIISK